MVVIDCAGDNETAYDLETYLKNIDIEAKAEESFVTVNKNNVEQLLRLFLLETNRVGYNMRKIDSENFLLSKEVQIEDFDLLRCEMCGHVLSNEYELMNHRRTHGLI